MATSRLYDRMLALPMSGAWTVKGSRARDRWLEGLMRFGQLARGLVYMIPGALGLRLAMVSGQMATNQKHALAVIGRQPLGPVLLLVVASGLAGYSFWGFYRALFDPFRRGHSPPGVVTRLGYLTSALAYGGLLWFAVQLVMGSRPDERTNQAWAVSVLSHPFGSWVVIGVGLIWIVAGGVVQLVAAWRGSFMRDLDLARMGRRERTWARHLGRIGLAARAVVFIVIGISVVGAGLHLDPKESQDLGGALVKLLREPLGRPLLTLISSGLVVFGAYSILCVRWARLRAAESPVGARASAGALS